MSLVELIIATAMISVVALTGVQSFKLITQGIRAGRAKTIAANLVQERMEVLKNMSYYQLLITTASATNGDFTPNLVYDTVNYPKETITLWGLPPFSRAVKVSYAAVSNGTVIEASDNSYDTGMKLVVVYLWWKDDNQNKLIELRNLYTNPDASNLDSGFKGLVKGYGATPLSGARISVIGQPEWLATAGSDATSNWTLPVTGGTYSLLFAADGYYEKIVSGQVCVRGAYTTVADQTLTQVASGTITGTVWISSHVLISQVVASTPIAGPLEVEYVELYNPTTYTWTADDTNLQLWYDEKQGAPARAKIPLTYVTASISPNTFYLIANRASVTIGGVTRTADAVYNPVGGDIIVANSEGTLALTHSTASDPWEMMCWDKNGSGFDPDCSREAVLGTLVENEQFVRYSTTNTIDMSLGPAYNNWSTADSFREVSPIAYGPRNSSVSLTPVTGTPAHSAVVSANDGYSGSVVAGYSGMGTSAEYAVFQLTGVATGTWTVNVTKGGLWATITNIAASGLGTTWVPSATTAPAWPATGHYNAILKSTTTGGFVQGYVKDGGGTALTNILVRATGNTARTTAAGYYLIPTTTGTVTVYANYGSDSPSYTTASADVVVTEGSVIDVSDLLLSNSGRIYGYVTSGMAAVPNVVVKAVRGVSVYQATSDQTGYFYITVPVNAGAYTVSAVLDPIQTQTVSPDPLEATIDVNGEVVHVGTITVIGGAGTVTGTVRDGGTVITTGVLIVASEADFATIGNPPPVIYASSAPGQTYLYYTASSAADGTYSLTARASAALNLRAYYYIVDPNKGTLTAKAVKDIAAVTVTAGGTTTGKDFSW